MGDADITLRHFTRRHAEALARPYVPSGAIEIVRWADTQVTAIERRLDKTLLLRLRGELHALTVEIMVRFDADLPDRVHDYQALGRVALRQEHPDERPPPMETVVLLLTGRREAWPPERALRTGWRSRRFSGTRFRVDALYQRTVAELCARGSPFWLAFTPLARDASATAMREVVAAIRADVPPGDDRWDLFAALLAMAGVDQWGHNLRPEIETMIEHEPMDLIQASSTLREVYEAGERKGEERGVERGIGRGFERLLRDLFARRLQRSLTAREQEALVARTAVDREQVEEALLALEGEALANWLLGPEPR